MQVEEQAITPSASDPQDTIPALEGTPEETPVPELPELRYEYQPVDELNRPLGNKQVLKYKTPEELTQKLVEQNTLLIRKLRQETRKNRLGISDDDEIPADAQRYSDPVEFNPRELSADERFQLSRDLLDPEKAIEAQTTLFEASVGVKPDTLRETLKNIQATTYQVMVRQQADAFVADNHEYFPCKENSDAITQWMARYNLAPVRENFQKAYDTLRNQDPPIIITRDMVETASRAAQPPAQAQPTQPAQPEQPAQAQQPPAQPPLQAPRLPTGFSRADTSPTGTTPPKAGEIVYEYEVNGQKRTLTGMAALQAMPGDEYGRRIMREPGFLKKVQAVEKEYEDTKRQRQTQGQ